MLRVARGSQAPKEDTNLQEQFSFPVSTHLVGCFKDEKRVGRRGGEISGSLVDYIVYFWHHGKVITRI